jgi:5-formyltetrahydrofolate cyclo-ligase
MSAVQLAKQAMRSEMRTKCRAMPSWDAERRARVATIRLKGMRAFQRAKRIAVHLSLPDELPTRLIVSLARAEGKPVLVPRMLPENQLEFVPLPEEDLLERNALGVQEPVTRVAAEPLMEGDLLLVPGLAFDAQGGRLGRGAGYYDRALEASVASGVVAIGWAYSFQLVAQVPMEVHDQRVSAVITDAE